VAEYESQEALKYANRKTVQSQEYKIKDGEALLWILISLKANES